MSTKRISVLKRLGTSNFSRSLSTGSNVNDARQLLNQRNSTTISDARQILSRTSTKSVEQIPTNIIVRKKVQAETNETGKMVVVTGLKDMKMQNGRLITAATGDVNSIQKKKQVFSVGPSTFVTIRNQGNNPPISSTQSTGKISFTKTIANPSVRPETTEIVPSASDQKVVISFVNDQYQKTTSTPPVVTKRLQDAGIQTSSSASRPPIRINAHQRPTTSKTTNKRMLSEDEDEVQHDSPVEEFYEPPVKRTNSTIRRTTKDSEDQPTSSVNSVKRTTTTTNVPVSSRVSSAVVKPISSSSTILITNLQSSVTEEDVIELFGEIGQINEIKTLSQGCVQLVYGKREFGEQAVAKYHNRLLDGQFMYVSLQQSPTPVKPSPTVNSSVQPKSIATTNSSVAQTSKESNQPLKFNATSSNSTKITIDPQFIRQALFHPSNNNTNPVQFQVKL